MDLDRIKENFSEHEGSVELNTENLKVINFRKKDTSTHAQRWIIDNTKLIVTGDNYNSIYIWSGKISLEFLAKCDLSYFSGKCVADKDGSGQTVLSSTATEDLMEHLVEYMSDRYEINVDEKENKSTEEVLRELVREVFMFIDTDFYDVDSVMKFFYINEEHDVYELYSNAGDLEPFIGSDFYEYSHLFREKTSVPYFHLAALKVCYEKTPNLF